MINSEQLADSFLRDSIDPDEPGYGLQLDPPPNHEIQILVRQIEPGLRMRASFCRNLTTEIPDVEPILHAIFDLVSEGRTIKTEDVGKLAEKYAEAEMIRQ